MAGVSFRTTVSNLLVGFMVILLVLTSLFMVPFAVGATEPAEPTERSVVVQLSDDGSGELTVVSTFVLTDSVEREAFESIQSESTVQDEAVARFDERISSVVAEAGDRVDRSMIVTDPTITLAVSDDGATGIVRLHVTVTNLAAVTEKQIAVTEPFASGYTTDRPFTISGPDGYELVSASPEPAEAAETSATWSADIALDGFSVTFERSDAAEADDQATESMPGFGVALAIISLLVSVGLLRRVRA